MKTKLFIHLAILSCLFITACNGEDDFSESEDTGLSVQDTDSVDKNEIVKFTIPIRKTATGYEPMTSPISSDVFNSNLAGGYWIHHESYYVFEDGSLSNPIKWIGWPVLFFSKNDDFTLLISYLSNGAGSDLRDWKEKLQERPYTYDEQTNTFAYGSAIPQMTYTVLSITEDEMYCTQIPDTILINDYHVQPHVLQYIGFKHYKTEEEFRKVVG